MILPTRNKYPKSLRVAGEIYKIRFVKVIAGEGKTLGTCDPDTKIIRIKKGMPAIETFATLVHELLHAIEFEYDIPIKHQTIYDLEVAIVELLVQNF